MTDPQEAGEDVRRTADNGGEPDRQPEDSQPSGVGGPPTAFQTGIEQALIGPSSPGDDADPDSQSRNPL